MAGAAMPPKAGKKADQKAKEEELRHLRDKFLEVSRKANQQEKASHSRDTHRLCLCTAIRVASR
jgi:hypothetical protein